MRALAIRSTLFGQLISLAGFWASPASEGQVTGDPKDPMAACLAALRAEEAKYQDLEYLIRTTSRKAGAKPGEAADEFTAEETRQVVLQGDRIFYRGSRRRPTAWETSSVRSRFLPTMGRHRAR